MKNSVITLAAWAGLAAVVSPAQIASHAPTKVATPQTTVAFQSNKVVARVDGAELKEIDLKRAVDRLFPYEGMHGNKIPGKYSAEIRGKAMNQIIFDELLYQEAKRRKMVVSAATIRDVEQQAQSRFAKQGAYEDFVSTGYGSVQGFERQIRRGVLVAKLTDQDITQKAQMSNARLREYYLHNKSRFMKPESFAIQGITVNIPDNPTPEQLSAARKRAQEILPKAKAAKDYEEFGRLAEKLSEDDWRVMMGDHKWIHRGRIAAAVEKVVFSMKLHETSDIIETPQALMIVRVNGYEPQKQLPFAEVKESMRQGIEAEATAKLREALEKRLRRVSKIEVL